MTITYIYYWTGIDLSGRRRHGRAAASQASIIIDRLAGSGVAVLTIRLSWRVVLHINWWQEQWRRMRSSTTLSLVDAGMVCRHLAVLQRAGVSLLSSLQVMQRIISNHAVRGVIATVEQRVSRGDSLADAFKQTAACWPVVVPMVVQAGEHAGELAMVLEQLADALSTKDYYIKKVWQALSVPLLTLGVGVMVFMGVVVMIVPLVASLSSAGASPTRIQLSLRVSVFLQQYGLLMLAGGCVAMFGVWYSFLLVGKRGRCWRDGMLYHLPLGGPLWAQAHALMLLRLLPVLLNAGVPLVAALSLVAPIPGNACWQDCLEQVVVKLRSGESAPSALMALPRAVMPPVVGQVLVLAHDQKGIARLCAHAADILDQQLTHTLYVRLALLQPVLMVFLGGGVLAVLYIFVGPMLNVVGDIGGGIA